MSASVRELALRAMVAALSATGTPAASVYRSQLDQITPEQLPCYDVSPGEEKVTDADYADHQAVDRTLAVMVRGVVDAGASDDSALDPLYVFAVQQLVSGNADLGGVVIDVAERGNTTVFKPEGRNIIGIEMHFDLTFATQRGDPTQKG